MKRLPDWVGAGVAVLEVHYAYVLPPDDQDLGFPGLVRDRT